MESEKQWFSIGEAAEYLGISKDTLRRWEKAGKIQTARSPTNRRYYTKKQLDEIISQGKKPKPTVSKKEIVIGKTEKLIIIGVLSFLLAILFSLTIQNFLLK